MIKDKRKLAIKLFIIVWIILVIDVILKITFNYWQPYVIPNEQLQVISDFIDSHIIIKIIINKSLCFIGTYFMILAGIQQWKFKKKYPLIILIICALVSATNDLLFNNYITIIDYILTIFTTIILPVIINWEKWLTILLTFGFSYLFLFLSLWIEGFSRTDNMQYLIKIFFDSDYYIMLILNYFVFNLIKKIKRKKV